MTVNYQKLFQKLLHRGVPVFVVKLLVFWYTYQQIRVRWGSTLSDPFTMSNGIKQGGKMSPIIFNVYMEGLTPLLTGTGVGCKAGSLLVNHLAYADDMVLLAPSPLALQCLLSVCDKYSSQYDILYSTDKTYCMIFWPKKFLCKYKPDFILQNDILEYIT